MVSARIFTVIALIHVAPAFAAQAADNSAVTGSMVSTAIRQTMSPQGLAEMEKARMKLLNEDSDQESAWQDPQADVAGSFRIHARKISHDGQVRCRQYIHALVKRSGGPFISEKTGKPLKYVDTVCFQNNRWERFKGDVNQLVLESGNAAATTTSTASDAAAPSGPTGPEHRLSNPNMVGPQALGQILDGFKLFKKNIDAQDSEDRKNLVREQLYGWVTQISEQMAKSSKVMALDQLALLLPEVMTDEAKVKVIQNFRARLDVSVGSRKDIVNMISSKSKRSQADRLLK